MAAPAYGTSGAWTSANSTTIAYAVPASVASGDIIVIPMFIDDSTRTITAMPTGFAHAPNSPRTVAAGNGGNHSINVVWKRATAADTGTYSFTISATGYLEGQAHRYTGAVASGTVWDVTAAADGGITGLATSPPVSVNTTGPDELLFFAATNWGGGAWTPPATFNERTDNASDLTADDKVQTSAGPSGTVQATCAATDKMGAWLGAIIGTTSGSAAANPFGSIAPARFAPTGQWRPQQFPQQPGAGPVRATATGFANGTTNVTVPASTVPGDMLVAVATLKNTVGTGTITPPAGWALLDGPVDMTGATGQAATYTKVATSADVGASQAWTPSTGQQCCVVVAVVAAASATLRSHNLADNGVTATVGVSCASATAQAGDVVLLVGGVRGSTTGGQPTFTGPYAFNVDGQVSANSGSAQNMAAVICDGRLYAAAAESVTASVASWSIAGQIVLQPGTASPSGPTQYTQTSAVAVASAAVVARRLATTRTVAVAVAGRLTRRVGVPRPVAVSGSAAVVRRVGAKRAVAGSAAVQVVRRLSTKRAVGVAAAVALRRRIARALAVTLTVLAAAVPSKTFLRSMTAAVSLAAGVARRVGVRRAAVVAAAASVRRALVLRRAVTAVGVPVLRRRVGLPRAVSVVAVLVLARRVGRRVAAAAGVATAVVRALRVARKTSVAAVTVRTGRVGRVLTAAAHVTLGLRRQVGTKRAAAVVASTSARRRIARALTVAAHAVATLVTIRVALLALHTAVTSAAILRRRVGKRATVAVAAVASVKKRLPRGVAIAVTVGPSLARRVGRKLPVAVAAAVASTARRVRLIALAVSASAALVLRRRIGRPAPRSVAATPSMVRRVGLRRALSVSVSPALVRGLRRRLAAAAHAAVSLGTTRVALLALHTAVACSTAARKTLRTARVVGVAGSATLRRRAGKVARVTAAATVTLRRQVRPRLVGGVTVVVGLRRRVAAHLAAAVHAATVNRFGRLYRLALAVSVAVTSAVATVVTAGKRFLPSFGRVLVKWALALTGALADQMAAPSVKWKLGGGLLASIPAVSTEFVRVEVAATANGVPVDPTADTVQMAFLSTFAEPGPADWKSASWDAANGRFYAQALVGPTGGVVTLTPGTWYVWVRIVASPETVIRNPGQLQIT